MIYSRTTCYTLLVDAIERVVLPQLTTPDALMVGAIAVNTLRELAKYETREPAVIAELMPQGLALGKEALVALRAIAPAQADKLATNLCAIEQAYGQGAAHDIEALGRTFKRLVEELDLAAKRMLEGRENAAENGGSERMTACLRDIAEWELRYHEAMMKPHVLPALTKAPPLKFLTAPTLEKRLKSAPGNPPDIRITRFDAVPGGMSKETFLFTTKDSVHGTREMAARQSDPGHVFDFDNYRLSSEYALVSRLHELGLPVAKPYGFFPRDAETDGDFYTMQKMEGKVPGTVFGAFEPIPEVLFLELAAYLARQHALGLEQFESYIRQHDNLRVLEESIQQCMFRYIKDWQHWWMQRTRMPSPGEAYMLDWLLNNLPQNTNRPVLVHSDCSVHNILVKDKHISAILDWEGAHFGDPAEDIAFVRSVVSAHMDWRKFVDHYRQSGGQPIYESALRFYESLVNFRIYCGSNKSFSRLTTGEHADVRMLPIAFTFFPRFMQSSIAATRD